MIAWPIDVFVQEIKSLDDEIHRAPFRIRTIGKTGGAAKATLSGIEAIRTIKHGHVHGKEPGVKGEIRFVESLFGLAA